MLNSLVSSIGYVAIFLSLLLFYGLIFIFFSSIYLVKKKNYIIIEIVSS